MTSSASDFGRYLQSVAERDIDLLLMEEFHVDPRFAAWFASLAGIGPNAIFDGAWHSVNDQDGETDLLLRVRDGNQRVAMLIENKIGAAPQDEQDIRYHLRGQRAQEAGRYERFVTAICAPQVYLDSVPSSSAYEHLIAYELIGDWFGRQDNARARWRRAIIAEAIEQGRRGYTMKVHAGRTAFHMAYWMVMQEEYPEFIMARPGAKGPKSSWIRFKGPAFPRGVTLNHKNDQGCMDLEFERTMVADLTSRRSASWPAGIQFAQTGKSAVLRLPVPSCDMDRALADQAPLVHEAFVAARKLAPLASMMTTR
jgi:hypothetical protein